MKTIQFSLIAGLATLHCHGDLIAHWPLDTDATDATGNGFNGAIVGGTVDFGQTGANANTGTSASFPDNGHIDIPFDAALNPGSFTVSLWVNSGPTGAHASPITSRDDVTGPLTHGYIIYHNPAGTWDFWTGDGDNGWDSLAGDPVAVNTWTHLAITYDANTDTKTLWIDGVISATDNIPQSGPTQYSPNGTLEMEDLHIGSGQDDGNNFYFNGLIDDVGIWDEALDGAVIQSIMANGISSGLPDPALSVSNPLDLNLDGTVQSLDVPVTNAGQTQNLNVTAATFNGDANFSVTTLPGVIAPGGTDNIVISFDPLGENGTFSADLEITSDDPLVPTRTITVQGAIHDPLLVSEPTLDLGEDTTGVLTITNNGATRPLNISELTFTGTHADKFSVNGPAIIAAGGASEDFNITFDAGGEDGTFTATLEITSDDPLVPVTSINIIAKVPIPNPLVAWWPLDVDGTDASGNGFNGTVEGTLTASEGANAATGGSLEFDGSSKIDVPFDQALNPGDFTVTLWANAASTSGFASPITSRDDVGGGTSTHGYIIYNDNGGNWNFWTGDGNPGWDTMAGGPVQVDTWTHLAISFDSATDTKSLWVDGVEVATESAPNQYSPNGTVEMENLHIGVGQDDGLNFWFTGKIDDVGLFRVALSGDDINSIMTSGVGGFTGAARALEITSLELGPGENQVTITFSSTNGANYIIERSTDLFNWEELNDNYPSGGETTTFTDLSLPADPSKLFYRVRRE